MQKQISTLLLLATVPVFAQQAATVIATQSKAMVNHHGQRINLAVGMHLDVNDAIITSSATAVTITYLDGTAVTLGPNSQYQVLGYSAKPAPVSINASLSKGFMESEYPTKGTIYRLKTPTGNLNTTGGQFKAFVANGKKTNIQVISGKLIVGSKVVHQGQSVALTRHGIFPEPFPSLGKGSVKRTKGANSGEGKFSAAAQAKSEIRTQASGAGLTSFVQTTILNPSQISNVGIQLVDVIQTRQREFIPIMPPIMPPNPFLP